MDIPKRSIRLDDEVWARLQALPGKTINEGLRSLLVEGSDQLAATLETLELVRSLPDAEQIETIIDAALQRKIEERAASRTQQPEELAQPGVCVCRHCGSNIVLRPGQAATSTCSRCIAVGHWSRAGDCRKCAELAHLAGIAAQDATALDRTNIEYDPSA